MTTVTVNGSTALSRRGDPSWRCVAGTRHTIGVGGSEEEVVTVWALLWVGHPAARAFRADLGGLVPGSLDLQ